MIINQYLTIAAIALSFGMTPLNLAQAQTPPIQPFQPKATAASRQAQILDQQQKAERSRFDMQKFPMSDRYITHWQDSLWALGIVTPNYTIPVLNQVLALTAAPNLSDSQKGIIDTAMQISLRFYTTQPKQYDQLRSQFLRTIKDSQDAVWVAMSLAALTQAPDQPQVNKDKLILQVKQRFPQWQQEDILRTTIQNLESDRPTTTPAIADLLQWQIAPNQPQMYVFCRPNRAVLCLTILKDGNGKFIKQGQRLWTTQLLLQSLHNLDWNFTNGRTPQGVYRMEGISRQPDDEYFHAYGQFSLVNLFLPFEDGANQFLPSQRGKFTGDLTNYQALLPPSWRNYAPIQQAFWAGKMGRSLFRIHGSGADVDFFSSKSTLVKAQNFAWNATLGCLSALEIYDPQGKLVKADMPKILDVLTTAGKGKIEGYLIVVDIPPKANESADAPVTIDAIDLPLSR
ncbi:MAG: hypothetical protein NW214_03930 [Pseudanabaenaceae cyanobacterium bins.39]|nr:hypothetical protein [Pseudanabaenaceae cyanobacterium bins.39]